MPIMDFGHNSFVTWTRESLEAEKETQMRNYRGLTKDGNKWVYGWYYYNHFVDEHKIFVCRDHSTFDIFEVIPESVGQQTGLKDKQGTEIYEGDIVKVCKTEILGHFHGAINCNVFVRIVAWNANNGRWVFSCAGHRQYLPWEDGAVEVLGNKAQTPELMEQDNDSKNSR